MVFLLAHIVPGDPVAQMLGEGARAEDCSNCATRLISICPSACNTRITLPACCAGTSASRFVFSSRCASDRLALSRDAGACLRGARCLRAIGIPADFLRRSSGEPRPTRTSASSRCSDLSVPNFALGPVLMLVFSVILGWLPVSGRGGIGHLILPAVTLGAALAAILDAHGARRGDRRAFERLRAHRAREGLSESAVLFRHAFRNALIPILTILGLQFGTLLAGTIVTETIFSWPGIGRLAVQAINARDYPLLQGCILLIAVSYVVVNLAHGFGLRRGRPAGEVRMKALREFLKPQRVRAAGASRSRCCWCSSRLPRRGSRATIPVAQNLPARLVAPSAAHWMGTDELGRDILSRIIYGTRVSMLVSVSVVLGAGIVGLAIGALAGYFGGWFDRFVEHRPDQRVSFVSRNSCSRSRSRHFWARASAK